MLILEGTWSVLWMGSRGRPGARSPRVEAWVRLGALGPDVVLAAEWPAPPWPGWVSSVLCLPQVHFSGPVTLAQAQGGLSRLSGPGGPVGPPPGSPVSSGQSSVPRGQYPGTDT